MLPGLVRARRGVVFTVTLAAAVVACGGKEDGSASGLCAPKLPAQSFPYSDADAPVPQHFLSSTAGTVLFTDVDARGHAVTNSGATLGRVLFYDRRLSVDNTVSCSSCHQQQFGFGDTAKVGRGVQQRRGSRKTMALANVRFYSPHRFFWDERASSLEAQVLMPIEDSLELGSNIDSLIPRLAATEYYPALFASAFGSTQVTRERIASALAQFLRTLVSSASRFDSIFSAGGVPNYTALGADELKGLQLFTTLGCVNCHRTIAQVSDRANNNGLDSIAADTGAGAGRFKAPSLRNVAVRPPYMHDGRFATLEQVVDFYDSHVHAADSLDERLVDGNNQPRRLGLSAQERAAVVAFLVALTDSSFLTAEKFSNPFPCG